MGRWMMNISIMGPLDGILCVKRYFLSEVYDGRRVLVDVGSSSWKALDLNRFFDGSECIDIDDAMPAMVPSADGRMLSMLGRYKVLGSNGSGSYRDALSVVSFDSSDEIYIQTPMPPSCEFRAGYYTNMDRLIYCLNHGATCALIFYPPVPRPMEIWVLIGCGAKAHTMVHSCFDGDMIYVTFAGPPGLACEACLCSSWALFTDQPNRPI
ncbi:hypothetical protein Dimus_032553 [Dionaea muscipula]